MGTATRVRTGPATGPAPGDSRRRDGGGAAAPAGERVARVRPPSRTGRVGPFLLWQVVLLEAALAVAAAGLALGGGWPVPALVVACALAVPAVIRRRGHTVPDWFAAALALRSRRRTTGPCAPDTDASLAPVAESLPGFRPFPHVDRERRTVGMLGDGTFLTAVVRVEAAGSSLRPASGARALPLSLLSDVLQVDDIVLESAQLVQQVRPAPAPHLPQQAVARLSYAPLQAGTGAPALRMTWVAVKLDPELCREAVEARGGGLGGARRCLVRAADHVASRISGAGFQAVVLDQEELNSTVATAACASPRLAARAGRPDAGPQRRTVETSRVWRCDDRWHTTYAVGRWPALGPAALPLQRLVSLITAGPAYATTFSLAVRRGPHRGSVNVAGHVRVTGGSDTELVGVRRAVEQAARSAGIGLVRLDREQLPGALATLPLGGAR
ncbi:type VII secretion protein EccE [Streptomyces sp. F63]|uniref:type VII secretion protein EccE n=1 Tax=Streptomyces sp. F63 TaxID=2824887 RepID=UPI001B387B66|nr:type VII secretion protein EccE [Streptomyces sp. F63]MBQ0984376.1 type VII secretion protein EccE [Streptomyces sp. F63]